MTDTSKILKALEFAAHKHRLQRRKNKAEPVGNNRERRTPYINHPIMVAHTISSIGGIDDPVVLCAAILHDTIEDTQTTEAELVETFGAAIANVVMEVTDDKSLPKQRRKELQVEHAAHKSHEAKLVKLGDKISNVSDLLAQPPSGWDIDRIRTYFDWAKAVIDGLRGTNEALEAKFDALYTQKP